MIRLRCGGVGTGESVDILEEYGDAARTYFTSGLWVVVLLLGLLSELCPLLSADLDFGVAGWVCILRDLAACLDLRSWTISAGVIFINRLLDLVRRGSDGRLRSLLIPVLGDGALPSPLARLTICDTMWDFGIFGVE